jgi:hypothetical protein
MNALFVVSVLLNGVDPTTDLPKPVPKRPADDSVPLTLPLGSVDDGPNLCIRFGGQVRMYFHQNIYPFSESVVFIERGRGWFGAGHNWYLGKDFSSSITLERGTNGLGLSVKLLWYPISGVNVELGFDLLKMKPVGNINLRL